MTVRVNLLPEAYRRQQRHERRFRLGVTVGIGLLAVELVIGLLLHARARDARAMIERAETCQADAATLRERLVEPEKEMTLVMQQVALAKRLRTTHRWSRLLGLLSRAAPDKVVLTSLSTTPQRWTEALNPPANPKDLPVAKAPPSKPLLEGVRLAGFAADHEDLSLFVAAIQGSGAFASANLTSARRDRFMEREAIKFEVECRW